MADCLDVEELPFDCEAVERNGDYGSRPLAYQFYSGRVFGRCIICSLHVVRPTIALALENMLPYKGDSSITSKAMLK